MLDHENDIEPKLHNKSELNDKLVYAHLFNKQDLQTD